MPEKLAIGGDKGFQVDAATENVVKHSELVLLSGNDPTVTVPLPCNDLPEVILNAIKAIQVCPSVAAMSAIATQLALASPTQSFQLHGYFPMWDVGLHQPLHHCCNIALVIGILTSSWLAPSVPYISCQVEVLLIHQQCWKAAWVSKPDMTYINAMIGAWPQF